MKAKIRIRFKHLGNSHGLGRAMHTREKRNTRLRETASIRDAESGRLPLPCEGGPGKEKETCCSQTESGESGRWIRDRVCWGEWRTQLERESNASTSCSQPPALGGDTYQLLYISFTFTPSAGSAAAPGQAQLKVFTQQVRTHIPSLAALLNATLRCYRRLSWQTARFPRCVCNK